LRKASDDTIDYTKLANQIEKGRRAKQPPQVRSASLSLEEDRTPVLVISGRNLAVNPRFAPVAVVNAKLADVISSSESEVKVRIDKKHDLGSDNQVVLAVDPFAVVKFQLKANQT